MATRQPAKPKGYKAKESVVGNMGTVQTDISGTDEDVTTVRHAEVDKGNLPRAKPSREKRGQ